MSMEEVCFVCGKHELNLGGLCYECATQEAIRPGNAYAATFGSFNDPPDRLPYPIPNPPQLSEQQPDRVDHGLDDAEEDGVGFDLADEEEDFYPEDDDDESDYENASDQDYNDYEAETEAERLRQDDEPTDAEIFNAGLAAGLAARQADEEERLRQTANLESMEDANAADQRGDNPPDEDY